LLLAEAADAARVAELTPLAKTLGHHFWPGALTIVMRKSPSYRSLALAGGETVAVRVPDHELVRRMVRDLGSPVTGTSANRAGAPAPVSAAEVAFQLGEMVELIIDGGRARGRAESTVVDITTRRVAKARSAEVERVLGDLGLTGVRRGGGVKQEVDMPMAGRYGGRRWAWWSAERCLRGRTTSCSGRCRMRRAG
jgi:tRNA threonylcarbamoyl adenosine modification protein (Sua5/YciO/YrdC/YwlC family)